MTLMQAMREEELEAITKATDILKARWITSFVDLDDK